MQRVCSRDTDPPLPLLKPELGRTLRLSPSAPSASLSCLCRASSPTPPTSTRRPAWSRRWPSYALPVRACCAQTDRSIKALREARGTADPAAQLRPICEKIRQRLAAAVSPSLSCGIIVGGAARDYHTECKGGEDVIVYLLSDPTNIDSKWLTFVKPGPHAEAILAALYKYNPLT